MLLDINSRCGYRKDSVKWKIACDSSRPVSLGNHGLEIIFASVFYSCRSPTLVLTWPITIMHRFFSRLAGYSKELALGSEGCFCENTFSGHE